MTVAFVLVAAVAVLLALLLGRPPRLAGAPPERPPVAVVVPARDEALTLPKLLSSVVPQLRPGDELVVVDDGSRDATAAVAVVYGARVVQVPRPGEGWTGKTWACDVGVQATTAELLVLLDADTWLAHDGLARLAGEYGRNAAGGLLSVQPRHVAVRPYEQFSALPNLVAVLASGIAAVCPPRPSPVAFGPCLVTTREALGAAGGFAAVRGELLEDAALARRFAAAERPVRCALGEHTVQFRMYPGGWRALVDGWTKHLAGGAVRAPRWSTLAAVAFVCALCGIVGSWLTAPAWLVAATWAATASVLAGALRWVGRFRWWAAAAWPVLLVGFAGLFVRSVWAVNVRREVAWRGRVVGTRA